MSAKEAAEKWNISHRRVTILCSENRIPNAAMLGNMWIIPRDADKPIDARNKRALKTNANSVRPFVKWAGGKGQIIEKLKQNLPDGLGKTIRKYAEPFVGGGALLFSLLNEYSFDEVLISDSNAELINAYIAIKSDCAALIKALRDIQDVYDTLSVEEQQAYYYKKRDKFNALKLSADTAKEKALLFIFLNKTCFNGLYRVNKSNMFNVPAGKYKNPLICDSENLLNVSKNLQKVKITCCDYKSVESFADESTFIYFDPPYRPLNCTSGFTSYTENQFGDQNQIELSEFYKKLSQKGAKLMLSNSDPHNTDINDNFFDELYSKFNIQRIDAIRAINSKGNMRGNIKELLITNN